MYNAIWHITKNKSHACLFREFSAVYFFLRSHIGIHIHIHVYFKSNWWILNDVAIFRLPFALSFLKWCLLPQKRSVAYHLSCFYRFEVTTLRHGSDKIHSSHQRHSTSTRCRFNYWLMIHWCFYFRTIRVWLRRDSGQYWPSICQYMPSGCTSLFYTPETRTLFIGQENGTISQFTLSDDCNRLTPIREYLAHQARITNVIFAKHTGWILSAGRDKFFAYHSTETGERLGCYTFEAICTAMQYPFLCFFRCYDSLYDVGFYSVGDLLVLDSTQYRTSSKKWHLDTM